VVIKKRLLTKNYKAAKQFNFR